MNESYKPQGYNSVSPYLMVAGADRTIDFLTRVFGATELQWFFHPDGKVMHAEVRIDDTYRRALEAGATSVQEPTRKDDDDKRGGMRDAGGTTRWIGTKVQ